MVGGGVGDAQLKMNVCAMINGGGVRVGLEDNIWLTPKRDKLASNMDLLKRIYLIVSIFRVGNCIPERSKILFRTETSFLPHPTGGGNMIGNY